LTQDPKLSPKQRRIFFLAIKDLFTQTKSSFSLSLASIVTALLSPPHQTVAMTSTFVFAQYSFYSVFLNNLTHQPP
jgi:hypothetical protein